MKWRELFSANFEESLNLQDDAFYNIANKTYKRALEENKLNWSLKNKILLVILSLLFPFGINFLIIGINNHIFYNVDSKDLTVSGIEFNFLPYSVYWFFVSLWILFILIGKRFSQRYLFIYRTHFHVQVVYLTWLIIEFNLFFLTMFYSSLTLLGVIAFFGIISLISFCIIRGRVLSLLELIYIETVKKTKLDDWLSKLIGFIFKYGWGFVLAGLLLKFIFPSSTGVRTDWLGYILVLGMWAVVNIAFTSAELFIFFPYFLYAYYKLKYPEEYREWEGKTREEWYGEKYLKKEERKKQNGRK